MVDVAIWVVVVILPVTVAVVTPIPIPVYVAGRRWLGVFGGRRPARVIARNLAIAFAEGYSPG